MENERLVNQKNQIEKRVFVIGAGMSAECGAPVVDQFLQTPFTDFIGEEILNSISRFISSAYPKGATPNIEEVLSLVDHAIKQGELLAGYNLYDLQKIRASLTYAIIEILTKICDKLYKDCKKSRVFYEIKDILEQKKLNPETKGIVNTYSCLVHILHHGDTVITLNYDFFLDLVIAYSFLFSRWENIDYGTNFFDLSFREGITCEEEPYLDYIRRPYPFLSGNMITILKLHGAINWAVCSNCKTIIYTGLDSLSKVLNTLQRVPLNLKHKYLCCPDFNFEPIIVPPTWMKDYNNRYLEDIWYVATRRLAEANTIIFLGYSFSESDYQIRYLFNRALHLHGSVPWNKIVIVNKNIDKVISSYERFFGKVEFFEEKTSEYLYRLLKTKN